MKLLYITKKKVNITILLCDTGLDTILVLDIYFNIYSTFIFNEYVLNMIYIIQIKTIGTYSYKIKYTTNKLLT
jgi:hypothetical protein